MATGFRATFALRWDQTEIDGLRAAPPGMLFLGAGWRWSGEHVRLDAAGATLRLESPLGMADLQRRAARRAGRLVGLRRSPPPADAAEDGAPLQGRGFAVTDGLRLFRLSVIEAATGTLVVAHGALPPPDVDLWVTEVAQVPAHPRRSVSDVGPGDGGLICFTPGTLIRTGRGALPIEAIRPGDHVQTKDNGLQPVLWRGQRHVTGARLLAMPGLRPVRVRAGALGLARPEAELVVSPRHRLLVQGAAARALFNSDEVLVAAGDLVNDHTILTDHFARSVTYIHILLDAHNILWANGVETESFLPDTDALSHLEPGPRSDLLAALSGPAGLAGGYGNPARRSLTRPEAALLRQD